MLPLVANVDKVNVNLCLWVLVSRFYRVGGEDKSTPKVSYINEHATPHWSRAWHFGWKSLVASAVEQGS